MTPLNLTLPPEELQRRFRELQTPEDVAELLDIRYSHLNYYLYRLPPAERYFQFQLPKRNGGSRTISAPNGSLKILQHKLLQILEANYEPRYSVHGFVHKRSIVTNSGSHIARRYVMKVDLVDFFPSVNFGRVRGLFMAHPYKLPPEVATVLAQICCHENQLPQGAPTSPIVSNMICARMDTELQQLARKHSCWYTRYADDITISTWLSVFPNAIGVSVDRLSSTRAEVGSELLEIIENNGFKVNESKVRLLLRNKHNQQVTGLTVNRRLNVPRKFVRQIRAMLHAWEKFGEDKAQKEFHDRYCGNSRGPGKKRPRFRDVLRGKLNFLRMVRGENDAIYIKYANMYRKLSNIQEFKELPVTYRNYSIFISYSRKQERFAQSLTAALQERGFEIWIDKENILAGEKWIKAIEKALQSCTLMLIVVTPDAMKSDMVNKEWQYFQKRHPEATIIPIILQPTEMPLGLDDLHYIMFDRRPFEDGIDELVDHISRVAQK